MILPQQLLANDVRQLCFDNEQAKKLLVEIKFGQDNLEKLQVCQEQYSTSLELNNTYQTQIKGLEADKIILTEVSEDYKQKFIATSEKLNKSEAEKPSRTTWFLIGSAVTTAIVLVATIFTLK